MKNIPRKTVQTAWCESCFGLLGEKSAIAPCFCSSSKLAAVAVPGHPPTPTPTPTRTHTHTRMRAHTHTHTWIHPEGRGWNEMKWYMSCHVITLACHVMSCRHGWSWLGHLAMSDNGSLQVRFHDDIDGSLLARAIYASTGSLLLPFDSGFPTHTASR